ncbi:ABC transporter substrate-binding protein [Pigmentiphaga sp.]|uniref:ABC transporter substrate-binding protein n=1 Tax=Pigmentiphaga sp. TaxID=1977564 RepID=UPI00128DEE9D|nr:ABC transporter substrate-binding protein [Pigmentiphaga sp.]MPS27317.1 ABC transporter substrate-binding protein [Alcaligenaceae bacterium SAGV5]MPS51453.1 ABC transporter substrate-binding protein [Alcaligenaceae bacterium SAGV3]MPT59735.1 ABC transporter substrate-binding protein [Alcaligenaceae bacterium]
MSGLELRFAAGPYDRLRGLYDGSVAIEGVRIVPHVRQRPVDIFSPMIEHGAFDIAEMSLTHCYALTAQRRANFVTLPVFPSRMFRHGFIFVNEAAGIRSPADLAGRRIGVQGHQMTAAVWIRGLLRDGYGVDLADAEWYEGGVNEYGVAGGDIMELRPSRPLRGQRIPATTCLSDMLAEGGIDALIGAFIPRSYGKHPAVRRLFPDYKRAEAAYYATTGVFPIMHALVLRRDRHEAHPWLAPALVRACEQAKDQAWQQLRFSGALAATLPWLMDHVEETLEAFGADPWPYGVDRNRATLEAFSTMLHADGYLDRALPPDEIFARH